MSSRVHGYWKPSPAALLIEIMLVTVFLINRQWRSLERICSPSCPARCFSKKVLLDCSNSVSVYMTYCGLTSCTVLCWSLTLGEGSGDGEWCVGWEERGLELKSQVSEQVPGLHGSDSWPSFCSWVSLQMVRLLKKCSGPGKRSRKSSLERLDSISVLILAAEKNIQDMVNS